MTKQRWVLVAFILSFVLPFVLGQWAYDRQWFAGGQTNQGELIQPPIALKKWFQPAADETRWWLVYAAPEDCQAVCEQQAQALLRIWKGIGRERQRVGILWLGHALPDALQSQPQVALGLPAEAPLQADHWYLADPMGWLMLRYVVPQDAEAAFHQAESLLQDLAKLLKVSRIG